ncbi:glucose-1-phosphate thymidylyltransferase [Streptomyces sp. CoH27]|uniref:glucose-1-phosphate thymidylyltransferase n=1 Tax=Streptomyces sp. CoH27 TaxID=2875763 RepID=UPI001CD2384B|nr:glucose-1-phosphate thymidylyltransferase [Streptomyces sp. CoH27]
MKALILSGGTGTRLRPFTYSIPKQLVPVANKPVLLHCLENVRDMGVTDVGVIVGGQEEQIRAAVGDGSELGLEITYIPQALPLGLAHCVLIARDFLGDDDFVMYLGDNMLVGGTAEAAEAFRKERPDAGLLVTEVADPRQFGVAEIDADGRVVALAEKPRFPRSNLALIGVYFFTPAIHEAVARLKPSARGELEITDAVQHLVERGHHVTAERFTGYWKDTGNVDDMLDCNRVLLNGLRSGGDRAGVDRNSVILGEVVLGPGARIIGSRLEGPIVVGAGTVIRDSHIGPHTAVGRDCELSGTGIANSIVLDGASIRDVQDIHGSLIGRWADVQAGASRPRRRLLVGDHSRISLPA